MSGSRIDAWMGTFDVSEYHERRVDAPPDRVYAAVRSVDLTASAAVRMLFTVRGLVRPGRSRAYTLDGFLSAGFTLLEEVPGREIVLGLTGRFWRPAGGLVRLTPEGFAAFSEPGWAQVAWNFHVLPAGNGCLLSTETRIRATDEASRRAFRRYWHVIGPFSGLVRRRALRLMAAEAQRGLRSNP